MSETTGQRHAIGESVLNERTVDIITRGRRTGTERTTEIWTTVIGGQAYICGTPNASKPGVVHQPRDWLANLVSTPTFVIRLKQSVHADLTASASRVTDAGRRREILLSPQCSYYVSQAADIEAAVAYCPIVAVSFIDESAWLNGALGTSSSAV